MVNVEQIEIIRHISAPELSQKIKEYSLGAKILKRLLFINMRYSGKSVVESCKLMGISLATGYKWQERWNLEGYAGLAPKYAGGKPSKLTDQQKKTLEEILRSHDHWTTSEVKQLVQNEFNIIYSLDQIRRILRKLKMQFGEPYPQDYRRPPDAEKLLKKTTQDE